MSTALPKKQNQSPITKCVYLGKQAELPCDYIPGNLRELYQVQWKFLNGTSVMPFTPNSLPFGALQAISNDSFTLSVSVNSLDQTGNRFFCEVRIQLSDNTAKYEGSTIELQVKGASDNSSSEIPVKIKVTIVCVSHKQKIEYVDLHECIPTCTNFAVS